MNDLISRQAAINALKIAYSTFAGTPTQKDTIEDCLEIIKNMPSARPIGKWIPNNNSLLDCSKCGLSALTEKGDYCLSLCGADMPSADRSTGKWIAYKGMQPPELHGKHYCSNCYHAIHLASNGNVYNYCPNCGANMKV